MGPFGYLKRLFEKAPRSRVVGCSRCFRDVGLVAVAEKFGAHLSGQCPSCKSLDGAKLTAQSLEAACAEFFVVGSVYSGKGWFAPLIQFNYFDRPFDLIGRQPLKRDIELLASKFGLRVFLYGPPLWAFGKPVEEDGQQHWTENDFDAIRAFHTETILDTGAVFYRVQCNIELTPEDSRFCAPPAALRTKFGRFDSADLPVLYCSLDVETCLHESRVSLEDEIYVATLRPTKTLRILDLSAPKVDFEVSPFDDPRIWLRSLIYDHGSYETCRSLSERIHQLEFDGFIVDSYFRQAAKTKHRNLCLFGRPVTSGIVQVDGINRVNLHNVMYEYGFGPGVFSDDLFVEAEDDSKEPISA